MKQFALRLLKVKTTAFKEVTLCSLLGGYKRFEATSFLLQGKPRANQMASEDGRPQGI
jgi:hypothetical protein